MQRRTMFVIIAIFAVALYMSVRKGGDSAYKRVSLTEFITAVRDGSVADVTIEGNVIRGTGTKKERTVAQDHAEIVRAAVEKGARLTYKDQGNAATFWNILNFALIGIMAWFFWSAMKNRGTGMLGTIGQSLSSEHVAPVATRFSDVGGIAEVVEELREVVELLMVPAAYNAIGARVPRGVLLHGPAGTGKTLLARAVAGEAGVPFFSAAGSDFVEMLVGVGASRLRDLFAKAKKRAPCIIFFDEIEALGRHRSGPGSISSHSEHDQTLNQLLTELDGFTPNNGVIVIGATNRVDMLDPALIRPGRFDRRVYVPLPDLKGREEILAIHGRSKKFAQDADLKRLAQATAAQSGAALEEILNEAAIHAARLVHTEIGAADLEYALYKRVMGKARSLGVMSAEELRICAWHEAGHALVGWFDPACEPIERVTVIPHEQALGVTVALPERDLSMLTEQQLNARIAMAFGGRVAETLIGSRSTGAENDLDQATEMARHMVMRWGMGAADSSLPPRSFGTQRTQPSFQRDYSERSAERIDIEIAAILNSNYARAKGLIESMPERHAALASALLERETLRRTDIEAILGPRPRT